MIRLDDLHKSFDGVPVLKGISFEVSSGEIVALVGGSGTGKSVLLKHIAGLLKPDKGKVIVDGKDVTSLKGKTLLQLRERLGFLFQGGALFDSMTVYENVAFPLKEKTKLKEEEIRQRVNRELQNVGLLGSEEKFPSQISGGMVKRAALARALIQDPEIMLFDEPTTGLDPIIGQAILELIHNCHKRLSFTGIIVTHEIPKIFSYVNRVLMLHKGELRADATPEELMASKDPVVKAFVGS
ncbi:MAG TPA: ATP-binding cassette domain-containing protein [Desulfobacterales bacterium]|nr:ATP-binding cassette domain-containing protein [Desulfobacterales bacterium]